MEFIYVQYVYYVLLNSHFADYTYLNSAALLLLKVISNFFQICYVRAKYFEESFKFYIFGFLIM